MLVEEKKEINVICSKYLSGRLESNPSSCESDSFPTGVGIQYNYNRYEHHTCKFEYIQSVSGIKKTHPFILIDGPMFSEKQSFIIHPILDTVYHITDNEKMKGIDTGKYEKLYNFIGSNKKILFCNVPVVLLRQFYGESYSKTRGRHWLCDMESTRQDFICEDGFLNRVCAKFFKCFKVDALNFMCMDSNVLSLIHKKISKAHRRNLLSDHYKNIRNGWSVFLSLFYRLYKCNARIFRTTDKVALYNLHLFYDTHIDLIMKMVDCAYYTDDNLLRCEVNINHSKAFHLSIYEEEYPHPVRCIHYGDLPDLSGIVDKVNTWRDIKPATTNPSLDKVLVYLLFCKTSHDTCQKRMYIKKVADNIREYPVIGDLYRLFLETSLLGNYLHCQNRPMHSARVNIHRFFKGATNLDFMEWMKQHPDLVRYCIREYYIYMCHRKYDIDMFLEASERWNEIKTIYINTMDSIRYKISISESDKTRSIITPDSLSGEFTVIFKRAKKSLNPYSKKLLKFPSFHGYIYKVMERFLISKSEGGYSKHYNAQILIDKKKKVLIHAIVKKLVDDLEERRKKFIEEFPSHPILPKCSNTVETKWLKVLGVSEENYNRFREMFFCYSTREFSDETASHYVKLILESRPLDYYMIMLFYKQLTIIHEEKSSISLTRDVSKHQISAIKLKYGLMPWQDIPEKLCYYYYCPSCKKWANCYIGLNSTDKKKIYSKGIDQCLCDINYNVFYCGRQNSQSTKKKQKEMNNLANGIGFENDDTKDVIDSISKSIKTRKKNLRLPIYKTGETILGHTLCHKTQLIAVNLVGRLFYLGGAYWGLCEICATITQFDGSRFSQMGFTCGFHSISHLDTVNYKYPHMIQENIISIPKPVTCFHCGKKGSCFKFNSKDLLDDTKGLNEYRIKKFYVCPVDWVKMSYFRKSTGLFSKLSEAIESIQKSDEIDRERKKKNKERNF